MKAGKEKNITEAILLLQMNARSCSTKRCAEHVRMALNEGGFDVRPSGDAKDYGPELERVGFLITAIYDGMRPFMLSPEGYMTGYKPISGDVTIIQPYPLGNPSGHMTMYDGKCWISDFRQRTMYSGDGYRDKKPAYVIYRYSY